MIDSVLNLVFRCSHRRLTRPVTPVPRKGQPVQPTYVVCLDCGKQFAYDTSEMRLGRVLPGPEPEKLAEVAPPEKKVSRKHLLWIFVPVGMLVGAILRNGRNRSHP